MVTFGPDGITGHPDHQAVSRWVDAAVARLEGPTPVVLHAAETTAQAGVLAEPPEVDLTGLTAIVQHDPADLALRIELPSAVLDRKLAALRAHRSQTAELEAHLGGDRYRRWVAVEGFALARISAELSA